MEVSGDLACPVSETAVSVSESAIHVVEEDSVVGQETVILSSGCAVFAMNNRVEQKCFDKRKASQGAKQKAADKKTLGVVFVDILDAGNDSH